MSNPHRILIPIALRHTPAPAPLAAPLPLLPFLAPHTPSPPFLAPGRRPGAFSKYKPERRYRKRKSEEECGGEARREPAGRGEYFRLPARKVNWQEMEERSELEETGSSLPHYYDPNCAPLLEGDPAETLHVAALLPPPRPADPRTVILSEEESLEEDRGGEGEGMVTEVVAGRADDPFLIVKRYFGKGRKGKAGRGKHKQIRKQYGSSCRAEATDVSVPPLQCELPHEQEESDWQTKCQHPQQQAQPGSSAAPNTVKEEQRQKQLLVQAIRPNQPLIC